MSSTRRRSERYQKDEMRVSKPYKRQKKTDLLNEFEMSYIEINRTPEITL